MTRPRTTRGSTSRDLEKDELLAFVCHLFCHEGLGPTEIKRRVKQEYSIDISREQAHRFIRRASTRGWIRFVPPEALLLQRRLKENKYSWLHDVSVVKTTTFEHVAYQGAKMLLEILQQHYPNGDVHIGFSGGYSLRTFARRFAELLREPTRHLPERITFHALVAGFDVSDPTTDPNAFFSYFVQDSAMQVETRFVALHSPALVDAALLPQLRVQAGIAEAYERAPEIDIIVTSTSCWKDQHSMLRHYLKVAGEPVGELEAAGCLGDMLWQPIGKKGPIELKRGLRAMAVKELSQVSEFVEEKNHVLLVAGPCASCREPKHKIVETILEQERRLVTHLVVDSHCARELLKTQ